ncbi:MAG: hypothetical protein MUC36_12355 [Planctomycetes bacterium]|jgi:hypothetical protein|nr:hypothetical protein [Planctomycetota bacterium]
MNILRLPILAAVAGFSTFLSAQVTVTFPSDHATVAGDGVAYYYPYSNGISRVMAVYEAWDLGIAPGTPIARLGVRQDGIQTAPGRSLQLEVRMGYTQRTAANLLSNFDNNYQGAAQTVFGPGVFALPTLTNQQPGQQVIWLDLSTPFVWQPANGNLLVEWRVLANSNANQAFSYPLDKASFLSPITSGSSTGCQHSGGQTATLTSSPTSIGSNWRIAVNNAPASSAVVLAVTVGQPLGAAFPLQALLPGIQSTCQGYLGGAFQVFGATTNTNGYYQWTVPVPNDRLLYNDLVISSQGLILDFFSPGGFVTTDGDQVQFGIDPAHTLLYSTGTVTAPTGTLLPNHGLVTLFQ